MLRNQDPLFIERFRREAKLSIGLSHPSLLPTLDWGQHDGFLYLVRDLVAGRTLAERQREGPLDEAETRAVMVPILEAVDHLHQQQLVHRNLKASKILLPTSLAPPLLLDMGLLRPVDPGQLTATDPSASMRRTIEENYLHRTEGALWTGTLDTLAPELLHGVPATPLSDQYSLGVVLYECLTGGSLYRSKDLLKEISEGAPAPPEGASPAMTTAVMRMLSKKAEDRYPSLGEAARAL